jgi:hypothetical protein
LAYENHLQIQAKDGGLKLLQISDNGKGIHKQDFPLVCQRYIFSNSDRKFHDFKIERIQRFAEHFDLWFPRRGSGFHHSRRSSFHHQQESGQSMRIQVIF